VLVQLLLALPLVQVSLQLLIRIHRRVKGITQEQR
jgi:hypothetical protein